MIRHMPAFALSLFAALAAFAAGQTADCSARSFEDAVNADIGRCTSLYHRYEFENIPDTPAPAGYAPFYIAHYGRHGSRFQMDEARLGVYDVVKRADEAGCLNATGRELLNRLKAIKSAHDGMYGALAARGANEQRLLAHRMHGRFPAVFASGGKVRCQSSTYHRCLASMANFATTLKGDAPGLDFEFETGDGCMAHMLPISNRPPSFSADVKALRAKLLHMFVKPDRLARTFFTDTPEAREIAGDPWLFADGLFAAACACEAIGIELGGLDLYDFFTHDELMALTKYKNGRYFAVLGNSAEFGDIVLPAAKPLAQDFARRACEAVRSGTVCADLRFGHDSALMPLAGLIGLVGAGDRSPAAESWMRCPVWKFMPMAANLQIVLYRNASGDILAKVLFNERETAVAGLDPFCGPYYRWADIVKRLDPTALRSQ